MSKTDRALADDLAAALREFETYADCVETGKQGEQRHKCRLCAVGGVGSFWNWNAVRHSPWCPVNTARAALARYDAARKEEGEDNGK